MKILNVFDAVRDGTFQDFKNFYEGNINVISGNLDLNLLCMAVTNDKNPEEKLQIIKFLFAEGIDVNYATQKKNEMHFIYFIFVFCDLL